MSDALFGIYKGTHNYPSSGTVTFGSDFANRDFVIPMAKFTFYDATGEELSGGSAPYIYIRMPGSFNTSLINGWSEAQGIFGSPATGTGGLFNASDSISSTLGRMGDGVLTSIQKQIIGALAGATGYATSAGQSGKAQIEFLQRKLLNNFQQLIYGGPSYRRFQLPFSMRPTDAQEAENMLSIISSFRVASSPRAADENGQIGEATNGGRGTFNTSVLEESTPPEPKKDDYKTEEEFNAAYQEWQNSQTEYWTESDVNQLITLSNSVFTFGYPDMCKFEIILYSQDEIATLFKSDFCMIESVAVDYGTQNKMTFFDGASATQYFPTDVNLTISLRESTLITAARATEEYNSGTVIL
jgi:hypothetical protein